MSYFTAVSGAGPPVLLLHGFPQTHHCWRGVTPLLSEANTVVACDLKGCGQSRAPAGGPRGEGYSKREIAAELVEVMEQAGFERFGVAGHDCGARVALVHWGAEEDALADSGPIGVWRRWADDVSGGPLRSGHFIPEEAPEELAASLREFFR